MLLFTFSVSFSALAEETIRLTNGEWKPYQSKTLKYYGVASRIVTEAFALEGVKVEYKFRPWKRAFIEAKLGKFDGSLIWAKVAQREKNFYFSDVVIIGRSTFFHLKSYPFNWETFDDLQGLEVGGTLGYSYAFDEGEWKGKFKISRVPKDEQNFAKLLRKRIQIVPVDLNVGYLILHEQFKPEEVQLITHHPKAYFSSSYHLILSKKVKRNKLLIKKFNKGLIRLRESGKYDQFITESLGGDISNN